VSADTAANAANPMPANPMPATPVPATPGVAAAEAGEARPVPRPHFPALDGYRGIAALLVLVSHVGYQSGFSISNTFGAPVMRMDIGVTLFFVLSGFLLYRPFAAWHAGQGRQPRAGAFLWNRALRIFPAYWLMLTVVMLTIHRHDLTPRIVTASYLLLQTFEPSLLLDAVGHTWTLCTEMSWYLFLPVLALLLTRPPGRLARVQRRIELGVVAAFFVIGIGFGVIVRGTTLLNPYIAGHWLPHYLGWFGAGMGLAVLSVHPGSRVAAVARSLAAAPGTCWAAALAVYALACTAISGPRLLTALDPWEGLMREILYLGASVLFLLPGVLGPADSRVSRALGSRVGVYLGNISYAVYLWHFPLLRVTFGWTDTPAFGGRFLLNLVVLLAVTLAIATLSWQLVERPALSLKSWRPSVALTARLAPLLRR
jgi:peptidoglycan/LPS O-acetylase OafA/YrhL